MTFVRARGEEGSGAGETLRHGERKTNRQRIACQVCEVVTTYAACRLFQFRFLLLQAF
jgi:hypothetical protein